MELLQHYYELYFSPHLDDAVMSCGGRIAQLRRAKQEILVVTLMAGDPPLGPLSELALLAHHFWGLSDGAVEQRRQEDASACTTLGAHWLHWPIPDCIYRRGAATGRPLYETNAAIHGTLHPDDEVWMEIVERLIVSLPTADRILVPLSIGNHVDHRLTRRVVEQIAGDSLLYYEDYPYVTFATSSAPPGTSGDNWQVEVHVLSEGDLALKTSAIAKYVSQLQCIFKTTDAVRDAIISESKARGGECYWRRHPISTRQDIVGTTGNSRTP